MFVYEIKKEDIGKQRIILKCNLCGKIDHDIYINNLMGNILLCDIGKRIYKVGEIYQVENSEQLEKRKNVKIP
jgi:hypothetical protein